MALSRRQRAVLPLLVSGLSEQEVARRTDTSDETIRRWKEQPEFAEVLNEALDLAFRDAVQKAAGADIAELLPKASATLRDILDDPKATRRTKLLAARAVYEITLKLRSMKKRNEQ